MKVRRIDSWCTFFFQAWSNCLGKEAGKRVPEIIFERNDDMKSTKLKRSIALIMAMVLALTGSIQGVGAYAAGTDDKEDTTKELALYDAEVRTDLEEDEVATAEDINVLKDSDYDVSDVKDGISFNENKVSVSYDSKRSGFDISTVGKYDTYYVVGPLSGKKAYLIHRTVSVDEPEFHSDSVSGNDSEEGSDDEEPEPDSHTEGEAVEDIMEKAVSGNNAASEAASETASEASTEATTENSRQDKEKDEPIVGEERKNDELPLSEGEIQSIQSNTASFKIYLDGGQDTELIEEGIDPETGNEGIEENSGDEAKSESNALTADGRAGSSILTAGAGLDADNNIVANNNYVKELATTPVESIDNPILDKISTLLASAFSFIFPSKVVQAAENKDSMTVSYSGYAAYCGHRTGIKYISEDGAYKNHLVFCMDMNKNTTNGTVNAGGKIKAQITFCLVNGARTLGGKCHTSKYSSDSASADYFITSAAIHVLNGEVSLSYYNDGSGVYKNIEQMVNDAKKLDKSKYNLETGLTKSVTYTISPKTTEWKEVSKGLYKTSDKFVRTKTGTITDVKYKITGAPDGLTVGEIKKDASDIVDENDLKKYDICVAQTDKDKASSNFYLYANEEAMKKIIANKSTIKVQAKAYADEKGGRKWTPTVVSQQKITFLEEFNTLSAKANVKVTSNFQPGSFSFMKTDKFKKTPIAGATYYLYEDKDCDDILCELSMDASTTGLYGTGVQTITQDKYYLKEVDNPEGYQLDDTVYEISTDYFTFYDKDGKVTKAASKTFTHEELSEPVGVIVNKKDAFTKKEIETAGFAVFNDAACTVRTVIDAEKNPSAVPIFHYDDDLGGAVSEKFMKTQDTYYVKEVEIPEGYKDPGTVWTVAPGIGDVAQLNVENTPIQCDVTADKKDSETGGTAQGDATLAGATYGLYAAEDIKYPDGSGIVTYKASDPITSAKGTDFKYMEVPAKKDTLIATVKTDSDSDFAFGNLYYGNYYIKEIKESEGYKLNPTVYDVKFKDDKNKHQNISLKREVTETPKKQAFQIIKVSTDGDNGETDKVQGAEFTVKLQSDIDKNGWDNAKTYDTLVTDETGFAKSKELPFGTYLVKETKTPKDLYKTDDFTVQITEDSRQPQAWRTLNDAPFKAYIRLVKKDKESGETVLLSGVTFKIRKGHSEGSESEYTYIEQKVGNQKISEFTTDETGTVTTPLKLKYGDYEVVEIKAPDGYLITDEAKPFTVTKEGAVEVTEDDDGDPVITVEMENQPVKGSIKIHKEGEVLAGAEYDTIIDRILTFVTGDNRSVRFKYEKTPLEGATYHVIADEDIYTPDHQTDEEGKRKLAVIDDIPAAAGTVIATLTTDENGEAEIDNLPLGKYRIEEVEAPEGFVLDETAKQVELKFGDNHTEVVYENAEFTDERVKTQLTLVKKNAVNEVPVEGATYGVYATVDITSKDGETLVEADSLIEAVKTDSEGKAVFEADLPLGRYYVKEMETAPGYLMDDSEYEVDFTYQDFKQALLTKEIEVKETPIIVEVSKTDITTGKEITGAKLEILDENDEVYAAWTTDGTPYSLNAMPAGDYTLKETFAPYGYMIANEVAFTVEETGEIQKVSMTDERVKGFIEIFKTDSETKKAIEGVTFEIRDEKGKKVQTLVTDKKGYAKSEELDICTYKENGDYDKDISYTVVETKAADGYVLDNKENKVTIHYDDSATEPICYQLHLTNKPEKPKEPKLPQTGGDYNPWMFGVVGGAILVSGIVMYFRRRKNTKPQA